MVQGNILHHNKQHKKEKTGLGPPTCGSYAEFFSVRETNPPIRDQKAHQGPPEAPPYMRKLCRIFFGPGNKPSHPGSKRPSGTTRSTPYMRKLCRIFFCLGQPSDQLAYQGTPRVTPCTTTSNKQHKKKTIVIFNIGKYGKIAFIRGYKGL